ncbi:MAG: hypothetical protein H6739_32060 [Alphaproteobacteria bacterium]|nr:hypothetical protein [Alphaproteobacteria bacterium]
MLPLMILLACQPKDEASDDSAAVADDTEVTADDTAETGETGETGDPEVFACGQVPDGPEATIPAIRLTSSVTWTLDFDEEAEANDLFDCAYTRDFEGVQLLDQPYLCPACDVIVKGTATMVEGEDCFAQISSSGAVRTEIWGFTVDGRLFRSGADNAAMGELTTFAPAAEGEDIEVAWSSESALSAGGVMLLEATGAMTFAADPDTLLVEPWAPREAPYAGGWPQNDPGDLSASYTLATGETFPNVRLQDQCGDMVDLWDFYGSYLILDASQYNCGPCQAMANTEHDFLVQMRAEGIPVRVLTFMGNGLGDPRGTPPPEIVDQWSEQFEVTEPLLYDRGFTYALFPSYLLETTGEDFGYPAWLIVDPEMNVLMGNVGFGDWNMAMDAIRADWGAR